ncbi:MAG: GNAT family N-acetyltransferase [Streptomyces sp.]|uniref:GNAT family N-acetyltransferase n=1 Tax=Streptomyces sp. TaxID=1931 RepID=UPI0025EDDE5B|nr:GNAT family N-acetyltransferase [Streptomyces sp.]MBW8792457.1 GNAT family N-acetyltransferase [Streptomyces sp.]
MDDTSLPPALRVRPMALADCERVSEIRVRGWQYAYRGLMPQSFLDGLSVERDAERRRSRFRDRGDAVTELVAERGGTIVGWAAHGPYRDGEVRTADAELYALYVDAAHLGTGAGRALLAAVLEQCAGHPCLYLWVLRENARARRFYEIAGFAADGVEEPYEVDGVPVPEVRYVRELGVTSA